MSSQLKRQSTPRVFVGTLLSNEGDWLMCQDVIQQQEDVIVTHHVVSDLNEKDAHNALWAAWRLQQNNHDIFVKVDADTVLISSTTLKEIHDQFMQNPMATSLQAPLHDYMTRELIDGLNAYTSNVQFTQTNDELYCDRAMTNGNVRTLTASQLPNSLVPAGVHCHYANELQGFHYGVHRMMKGQKDVIRKVISAWETENNRVRGFAMIGSLMAGRFFNDRRFNYTDVEFQHSYKEAESRYDEFMSAIVSGRFDVIN